MAEIKMMHESDKDTDVLDENENGNADIIADEKRKEFSHERKRKKDPNWVDKRPKKRKPGFHEQMFSETSYYFKNGLRYVYPYPFTFVAHIKGRWLGSKVLDVFKKEFHMESPEYYEQAIRCGKIKVNNAPVDGERILTQKDILQTCVHRHEPPVIHEELQFLENSDDMVVVNKPSSIPVHPCGRYRHNTIVFLLGKEHGLDKLHTIHRIDRLTSGILMFAKTPSKAREMEAAVKSRVVEKEYLARVVGEFQEDEIEVDQPILVMSHKIGVCRVSDEGKPCKTIFKKVSYNGKTSLVKCIPHTGRMHQIRVHLQWLGYPIVNDPIYNHPTAWGKGQGKDGAVNDTSQVIAELIRTRKDTAEEEIDPGTKESIKKDSKTESKSIDRMYESGNKSPTPSERTANEYSSNDSAETDISPNITTSETVSIEMPNTSFVSEVPKTCNDSNTENTTSNSLIAKDSCLQSSCAEDQYDTSRDQYYTSRDQYYTSRDIGEEYHDESCSECKRRWKVPTQNELVMFLHARKYKGPGWEYETSLPYWAQKDWMD